MGYIRAKSKFDSARFGANWPENKKKTSSVRQNNFLVMINAVNFFFIFFFLEFLHNYELILATIFF